MSAKRLQVHLNLPTSLMEPRLDGKGLSKLSTERNCRRSMGTVLSGSGSIWSRISRSNSFESLCIAGGPFILPLSRRAVCFLLGGTAQHRSFFFGQEDESERGYVIYRKARPENSALVATGGTSIMLQQQHQQQAVGGVWQISGRTARSIHQIHLARCGW